MRQLLTLCLFLFCSYRISLARYTTDPESGSGEVDSTALSSATESYGFTTENSVKTVNGRTPSSNILETIKQFLNEYMLLVIVVGSLVILLIVTMCAAVIMSHKRKASAYYPSSFPPKEYVNHDDRNGGVRAFNEIPEKSHDIKPEDVVPSSNQLQTDILNAAQNLKSPTKGCKGQKIQEEPQNTPEPLQNEHTEEVTNDKAAENSQTQEETPDDKVKEAPVDPEETKPPCNCQRAPANPLAQIKPTEETIPTGESQETPGKPGKESTPPGNCEVTPPAELPEETKPTNTTQEVPAECKADVPNAPEKINGKEEENSTPTECSTTKSDPCNNQEPQQAPKTEPCGV